MGIISPFDLPELCQSIACFMRKVDFARCTLVCRQWHATFTPFLWQDINLDFSGGQVLPALNALIKHSKFVRRMVVFNHQGAYLSPMYMNLKELAIAGSYCLPAEVVSLKPSLTTLMLTSCIFENPTSFWDAVLELQHLRHLSMVRVDVAQENIQSFWDVCSRLETLRLTRMRLPCVPDKSLVFPRTKSLSIFYLQNLTPEACLAWFRQHPNLEELAWKGMAPVVRPDTLSSSIVKETWPRLEVLDLAYTGISDRVLSEILHGLRRVRTLLATGTGFSELSIDALRPHLPDLQELDIPKYERPQGNLTSKLMLDVLASSPHLVAVSGCHVYVEHMVHDQRPWVCGKSLKTLRLCFEFPKEYILDLHSNIFARLSMLTCLEVLDVSSYTKLWHGTISGLDLRLSKGLAQLHTLTGLRSVGFRHIWQEIEQEDLQWMVDHWNKIESFDGHFNGDMHTNRLLRAMIDGALERTLRKVGITA
ncbi:hypothetical protein EDD21DRAFT_375391 [Dissophora ornata]|nr:hypothetical protein EDD21DRAFT_375391 [Dissophora ornata]